MNAQEVRTAHGLSSFPDGAKVRRKSYPGAEYVVLGSGHVPSLTEEEMVAVRRTNGPDAGSLFTFRAYNIELVPDEVTITIPREAAVAYAGFEKALPAGVKPGRNTAQIIEACKAALQ